MSKPFDAESPAKFTKRVLGQLHDLLAKGSPASCLARTLKGRVRGTTAVVRGLRGPLYAGPPVVSCDGTVAEWIKP